MVPSFHGITHIIDKAELQVSVEQQEQVSDAMDKKGALNQETSSLGNKLIEPGKLPVDVDELTTVETVDSEEVGITKCSKRNNDHLIFYLDIANAVLWGVLCDLSLDKF